MTNIFNHTYSNIHHLANKKTSLKVLTTNWPQTNMAGTKEKPRTRLHYYQFMKLNEVFLSDTLPIALIMDRLGPFLSQKLQTSKIVCREYLKNEIKHEIIMGGSLAYNRLIQVLKQAPRFPGDHKAHTETACLLETHNIKELFKFVWLYFPGQIIMIRSDALYIDKETCFSAGKREKPSYYTYAGEGAPFAVLCVESLCVCSIFDNEVKQHESIAEIYDLVEQLVRPLCRCYLEEDIQCSFT